MAIDKGDADFLEEGGPADTLNASEGTDSDEVRNDDGDVVVDPPEGWSEANRLGMTAREEREGKSLDTRLARKSRVYPTCPMTMVPRAPIGARLTTPPKTATRCTTS
jgi:hypothetical protein